MTVTVEKLYEMCEVLDAAKDSVAEKEAEYTTILGGTKGGLNEKKLTSQLIVRYFHKFPKLRERALDAIFELCEDDDVNIRKFVIRNLASLCKESGVHVSKIADVLTQLLQTEDAEEMKIVQSALTQLLNKFTKETLGTIFGHVLGSEEGTELIRERAIKFLALKLKDLPPAVATKEIQEYIKSQIDEVMKDVSGEEFVLLMHILSSLSTLQTVQGRQALLELVTKQAELDKEFNPKDGDRVDQVAQCTRQAIPFLSKNVTSLPFMSFYLDKVMPSLDAIANTDSRLELLRVMAELAPDSAPLPEDSDAKLQLVLTNLMNRLPLPPSQTEGEKKEEKKENGAAEAESDEPKIVFSEVEAILISFHALCKKHPDFLAKMPEKREEEVKDMRKRLAYVARVIQVYTTKLQTALRAMPKEDLAKDENKIKVMAMRTTSNIATLLKDLLHGANLTYRSVVRPSWKPTTGALNPGRRMIGGPAGDGPSPPKRVRAEATFHHTKHQHTEQQSYYQPPSGKYSENIGSVPGKEVFEERGTSGGGRRGRGRGRRGSY